MVEDDLMMDDSEEEDDMSSGDSSSYVGSSEYEVKEAKIVLNTGLSGVASYATGLINGYLDCVIIKTDKPVNIKICLNDYEEIVLFENRNVSGTSYLPLRHSAMDMNGDKFNYAPEKYALNDIIRIDVRSVANAEVNVMIRWC